MERPPTRRVWLPLPIAFALVAALHVALLVLWGDPEPLHDELGYLKTGQQAAAALTGDGDPAALGRVAWHNPVYGALFAVAGLVFDDPALPVRLLQVLAGLLSGLLLFHGLRPRAGDRVALIGAAVLWLHPSLVFFRLSFWPVSMAVLLTSAVALCVLRLADAPDERGRQWELGLALAPLPFFAPQALALLPALLVWPGPRRAGRVLGPLLVLWVPWMVAASLTLGTFTPMDLAAPSNLALGNHDAVAPDRGSLWGDAAGKAELQADLDAACGQPDQADRIRCEAAESVRLARAAVARAPGAAAERAALRLVETWQPDTFLVRRLRERGLAPPPVLDVGLAVLLVALVGAALAGLRTREGRAAWLAVVLWCVPVMLTVGFTRLRQPLLPWLVVAAVFGLAGPAARARKGP